MILASTFAMLMMQATGGAPPVTAPQSLTRAAVQASIKANFETLDVNKDGSVDQVEATKALNAAMAAVQKRRAVQIAAEFAKLDTNKNGSISRLEFEAMFGKVRAAEGPSWINVNDENKDGRVSLAEATSKTMGDFDRRDTDRNGILSASEAQGRPAAVPQGSPATTPQGR